MEIEKISKQLKVINDKFEQEKFSLKYYKKIIGYSKEFRNWIFSSETKKFNTFYSCFRDILRLLNSYSVDESLKRGSWLLKYDKHFSSAVHKMKKTNWHISAVIKGYINYYLFNLMYNNSELEYLIVDAKKELMEMYSFFNEADPEYKEREKSSYFEMISLDFLINIYLENYEYIVKTYESEYNYEFLEFNEFPIQILKLCYVMAKLKIGVCKDISETDLIWIHQLFRLRYYIGYYLYEDTYTNAIYLLYFTEYIFKRYSNSFLDFKQIAEDLKIKNIIAEMDQMSSEK